MNRRKTTLPRYLLPALLVLAGCGARTSDEKVSPSKGTPAQPVTTPDASTAGAADAQSASTDASVIAAKPVPRHMGIIGITGSLNRGDVQHAMEARTEVLLACTETRPRRLRFVGGRIDFHIDVAADGRVIEARPVHSTIGYRPLELCLTEVVEQTVLPAPDGRDRTDIAWGMNVEPDRGREPPPLNAKAIEKTMKKYAGESYKACKVRRRTRFQVTAYAGRRGKVLAVSAVPLRRTVPPEKLDCLLEEIKAWRLPRLKRRSKATFTLKWKPPPPKKRRYAKSKRGKRRKRGKRARARRR